MTPVALGALPSNQPAPTGLVQYKRGAANAQTVCPADSYAMGDGAGGYMQIGITTGARPGWWIIRAENIFIIADAAWYYFAWYVNLNVADANGIQNEYAHHRLHSALGWEQSCIDTAYRLAANTSYLATMVFGYRQAGTVYYWTGPDYCTIQGEFIGEGSL
jgi:hypothetical protein